MSDTEALPPSRDAQAPAAATPQPSAPPISAATRYWQGVAAAGRDARKAAGPPQAATPRAAVPQTSAEMPVRSRSVRP